jgi:EthD domain
VSGIKMFALLPKNPSVTGDYFHDHWRHPHGTWGKQISTIQQYVQSHRIHCDRLDAAQDRYEGCAEVWLDSIEDCRGMGQHPTYRKYLADDEPLFVDMNGIQFAFMDEEVIDSGPAPEERKGSADFLWRERECPVTVKLMQFISGRERICWRPEDVRLGRSIGALRHVRAIPNQTLHPGGQPVPVAPHSTRPEQNDPLIGVRELWWPTKSDFDVAVRNNLAALSQLLNQMPGSYTMLCQAERML